MRRSGGGDGDKGRDRVFETARVGYEKTRVFETARVGNERAGVFETARVGDEKTECSNRGDDPGLGEWDHHGGDESGGRLAGREDRIIVSRRREMLRNVDKRSSSAFGARESRRLRYHVFASSAEPSAYS